MYPWQSGSNGAELTPDAPPQPALRPLDARTTPVCQRHINAAIAYNVWQYHQATNDVEFLAFYGAEMIIEIARFWASIAHLRPARDRYEIRGVMGPDEYHDAYPGPSDPGSTTTPTPT